MFIKIFGKKDPLFENTPKSLKRNFWKILGKMGFYFYGGFGIIYIWKMK